MRTKTFVLVGILLTSICMVGLFIASRERFANFQQNPCAPSCWYGIVPGKSARQDVRRILPQLPFVQPFSIMEYVPARYDVGFSWLKKWRFDVRDWIELDQNDVVLGIVVHPDAPLRLDDVIQAIGVPEKIQLYAVGAETSRVFLSLFYPRQGLVLKVFVSDGHAYREAEEIGPEMPVVLVEYRVVDSSPKPLVFWNSWRRDYQLFLDTVQDWPGYGLIRVRP